MARLMFMFVLPVLLFAVLLYGISRSRVLFVITVKKGRIANVRGRCPPGLVGELSDALKGSDATGRLIAVPEGDIARVDGVGSFSKDTLQRVRNVLGTVPLTRLRATPPR
ncbi:MAG: DUF3634 family protein [Deltaproteobacteria bacterium]|nr:DUF3634 family protein [Deltaproteobacteria bacterium]